MIVDWDKLRVFHTVADVGSFTRAGQRLSLSQSAVSRQVSALEMELGFQLFYRHTRGLRLTEQGQQLYGTAKDIVRKISVAQTTLRDSKEEAAGNLRIAMTVAFGSTWLTPRIKKFLSLYPDINVSLILDDEELDLPLHQADIGIRLRPPQEERLIKLKLRDVSFVVCGSRRYFEKAPVPESLADLDDHPIVTYGEFAPGYFSEINTLLRAGRTKQAGPREPVLRVNNVYGVLLAVKNETGIAMLPEYLVLRDLEIQQVLPEFCGPKFEMHLVYPEELRNFKKVQAFRDFLIEELNAFGNS